MIRKAEIEDLHDIRRMLQDFARIVLDEDIASVECEDTLQELVQNHIVLVSDTDGITGMMLGQFIQHPFWKKTMLQEVAWYATDNSGGSLLREFIRQGREAEVEAIYLTVLESAGPRVHGAMKRLGFETVERSYIMKL